MGLEEELAAAEQCEKAAEASQTTTEAELSFLHQQVEGVSSLIEKASDKVGHRRVLQRERSSMFEALGRWAKQALCNICDENVSCPLEADAAGYLSDNPQVLVECPCVATGCIDFFFCY